VAELEHTIELHRRGKVAEALATVNLAMKATMDAARAAITSASDRIVAARDADRAEAAYRIRRGAIMLAIMEMTIASSSSTGGAACRTLQRKMESWPTSSGRLEPYDTFVRSAR